jgi:hypothetical protein
MSRMLGTARSEVAKAAGRFRRYGIIDYHHGNVVVISREGLETDVCECYWMVRKEFEQVFPKRSP